MVEAARQAFWRLGAAPLGKLADLRGVSFESGMGLCAKIHALMVNILKIPDEEVLEIIQLRMHTDDFMSVFAQLDDVQDLVAKEDAKDFDKERVDLAKDIASNERFCLEWQSLKAQVVAQRSKKAKRVALVSSDGKAYPSTYPEGSLTHAQAVALNPPGAKFYEDLVNGRWQVMFKNQSRSRAWMAYGRTEACRLTIMESWRLYLFSECRPESDCPIKGVFRESASPPPDQPASARPKAGAASSSSGRA